MKAWGMLPAQWDELPEADKAVILAHEANESEKCPNCGGRIDSHEPFEVVRHECVGCQTVAKVTDKAKPKPGIFYAIRRIIKS